MPSKKYQLEIFGLMKDAEFYQAKVTAEGLYQKSDSEFFKPICKGMMEYQWLQFLEGKKQEKGGELWSYSGTTLVFVDKVLLGPAEEFIKWAGDKHDYQEFRPLPLFYALAKEEYKDYLKSTKHYYVYLDVSIGKEKNGRLLIELFNDKLPKTCDNFMQLCIGDTCENAKHDPPLKLAYKDSLFHRIVKNGWIQGGDIVHGKGDGGWSIYGETFEDENYSVANNTRGIVGMANKGRHSNASQFFITLQPTPWMDCQYVSFGEVVEGLKVLDKLENVPTYNERPMSECMIYDCGVLDVDNLYT